MHHSNQNRNKDGTDGVVNSSAYSHACSWRCTQYKGDDTVSHVLNRRSFLLGGVVLIGTCTLGAESPKGHCQNSPAQQLLGIYTGTLPCADCRGIRTVLSL